MYVFSLPRAAGANSSFDGDGCTSARQNAIALMARIKQECFKQIERIREASMILVFKG